MKVIVVGAGLAGLTAAWKIRQQGHDPVVLEARNRVGGRTWSEILDNGQLTERGGEYVFPTEFAIRHLSAEVRVPILTHNVRYARRTVNGTHLSLDELNAVTDRLLATLSEMLADGVLNASVDDVFRATVGANFHAHPAYRRMSTSLAGDAALISAEAALMHESSAAGGYVEDGGRFLGGNQSLAIELARLLGPVVRLESPIRAIDQSKTGVQVTLLDGSTIDGDAAVLAVPLPILRTLRLGFELPAAQRAALKHRSMGTAAKLGVPLSAVDADMALQNADHAWWSWRSMSVDGEGRIPALSCFAGGHSTLAALETANGADRWVAELRRMRPELVIDGDVLLTDWTNDEWTGGCYSAPTLAWRPEDASAFDTAAGLVAIAGEHTGLQQSLNGAVESGYRAASAIAAVAAIA
ncbi:NAD(P)/FAD-dependent oxidoreductase [Cryobacterium sp. PH31-O1]|uniref:flavin monoamine oxidase family protein n=1 Tax=Cryobacterium sp. PH31-O1 TaxID=3046306 RepID=UPI0024BBC83A|nr:NAD(P)/FAD-dependent oxidoreductase [Cryobacterium sp. PH31-O1]MDJ0339035.1 NAD(P)/FAD-dependent oxidoreductase [Cryobacterium sp. PH31-O1]